jgi:hypothetical protein
MLCHYIVGGKRPFGYPDLAFNREIILSNQCPINSCNAHGQELHEGMSRLERRAQRSSILAGPTERFEFLDTKAGQASSSADRLKRYGGGNDGIQGNE